MTRDRICFLILLSSVSLLLHTSQYKYAPVVFWFAVRLEINIRKNRLLFSLVAKKPYILSIMHLKVDFLVWVEVWEFLPFYFIYYIYLNVFVNGSGAPPPSPLSRSPHLYSDLTPLLSRISPSSPLLIPASALGVLLAPAPLRLPLHNIPPKYPLPFPPTLPPTVCYSPFPHSWL